MGSTQNRITWYLAGPMSGIPQFNIPAFNAAAKALRAGGYTVLSPAEIDSPEVREHVLKSPDGQPGSDPNGSWGDYLARDVKLIADRCGGVCLLPGWEESRGARLELMVALSCGHLVAEYRNSRMHLLPSVMAGEALTRAMMRALGVRNASW